MNNIVKRESFAQTAGSRLFEVHFDGKQGCVYFFVLIARPKINAFINALNDTTKLRNLRDWGDIIKSGYGEPPEELKRELNQKYS